MDPAIRAQLQKVEVIADPEIEKVFPALQRVIVHIDTRDGRSFNKQLDYPKGDPRNPLTDQEVEEKFSALAEGVLSDRRAEARKRRDLEPGAGRFGQRTDGADGIRRSQSKVGKGQTAIRGRVPRPEEPQACARITRNRCNEDLARRDTRSPERLEFSYASDDCRKDRASSPRRWPAAPAAHGRLRFHPSVSHHDPRQHVGGDEQVQSNWREERSMIPEATRLRPRSRHPESR